MMGGDGGGGSSDYWGSIGAREWKLKEMCVGMYSNDDDDDDDDDDDGYDTIAF